MTILKSNLEILLPELYITKKIFHNQTGSLEEIKLYSQMIDTSEQNYFFIVIEFSPFEVALQNFFDDSSLLRN